MFIKKIIITFLFIFLFICILSCQSQVNLYHYSYLSPPKYTTVKINIKWPLQQGLKIKLIPSNTMSMSIKINEIQKIFNNPNILEKEYSIAHSDPVIKLVSGNYVNLSLNASAWSQQDGGGELLAEGNSTWSTNLISDTVMDGPVITMERVSPINNNYDIVTFAGGVIPDNIPAVNADLLYPYGITSDNNGKYYITDMDNSTVSCVDSAGIIHHIAGKGKGGYSGDGGQAVSAMLNAPADICLDNNGNIYISDSDNNCIRKITPDGIISTIAGNGTAGFSGDNGPAISASLNMPVGLTFDSNGNLYIADTSNHRIRKIDTNGIITTIAGNGNQGFSGDGGDPLNATLKSPGFIAINNNKIYISDSSNHCIRMINNNIITTIAGIGANAGYSGDGGPATSAKLKNPKGITIDNFGNLYIVDSSNHIIRRVDTTGNINTIAGTPQVSGFSGDGTTATAAELSYPRDINIGSNGYLYFTDSFNYRIRGVDGGGIIRTVAGGNIGMPDGASPLGITIGSVLAMVKDQWENIYFEDLKAYIIRMICKKSGTYYGMVMEKDKVYTIAGNRTDGYTGDGGPATSAQLGDAVAMDIDEQGNLVFFDQYNHVIRFVCGQSGVYFGQNFTAGNIYTIAGDGNYGFSGDNGPALNARVTNGNGAIFDEYGNVYISDTNVQRIRMIVNTNGNYFGQARTAGYIYTIIGNGTAGDTPDGTLALNAAFRWPNQLVLDSYNNILIAENKGRISMYCATNGTYYGKNMETGKVYTVAGNGIQGFAGDGDLAVNAQLDNSSRIALDNNNNIYISDSGNNRVRKITTAGIIDTIAGNGDWGFSGDGGLAKNATFNWPGAIIVDNKGNVYFNDDWNGRIRLLQ